MKNDRYYYYRVQASDKNLNVAVDKNETISPLSEPMRVSLLGYVGIDNIAEEVGVLMVEYTLDGGVFVNIGEQPTDNSVLYIYSVDGRLVDTIKPISERVSLTNLFANGIYLLKYSVTGDVNSINKIGKLIY